MSSFDLRYTVTVTLQDPTVNVGRPAALDFRLSTDRHPSRFYFNLKPLFTYYTDNANAASA